MMIQAMVLLLIKRILQVVKLLRWNNIIKKKTPKNLEYSDELIHDQHRFIKSSLSNDCFKINKF